MKREMGVHTSVEGPGGGKNAKPMAQITHTSRINKITECQQRERHKIWWNLIPPVYEILLHFYDSLYGMKAAIQIKILRY